MQDSRPDPNFLVGLTPISTDIPEYFFQKANALGITSGASVPDILVEALVSKILQKFPSIKPKTLELLQENVEFALPEI